LEQELEECTFFPSTTKDENPNRSLSALSSRSMSSAAFKSFVKRNVEDFKKFKEARLEAKDEYFYRDLRQKPQITERSRKIVRSISAQRASQFGCRPWTQNADRSSLKVTTMYSLANQTLLNQSLR